MLTLFGARKQRLCDGISRRDFLRIGALGAGGLTLADLLRLRAQGKAPSRPKSVIMIYLAGGPSHIDTYDLKPDAPVEYRGEFKPMATNVPGMTVCELLPRQAQMADKLAVIRSLTYRNDVNGHLLHELTSGFRYVVGGGQAVAVRPPLGSVVSKMRGWAGAMPPFVALGGAGGLGNPYDPLYLGKAHQPFTPLGPIGQSLRPTPGLTLERLHERHQLLSSFDQLRRDLDHDGNLAAADVFTRQAVEMIASGQVRQALDLNQEPERVRQRYNPEPAGSANAPDFLNLLLARRLVEAGVPVVSLCLLSGLWDTHKDNCKTLRTLLPKYDHALSALIGDLYERGLDRDVAVVVWGEFGRTPKLDGNGGRSHWPEAGFCVLAGGDWKTGQAIGTTDRFAGQPKERPYTPQHVLGMVYRHLGIDPSLALLDATGRPQYMLDEREPIVELA